MGGESGKGFEVEITFEQLNEILDLELPNSKPRDSGDMEAIERMKDGGVHRTSQMAKFCGRA